MSAPRKSNARARSEESGSCSPRDAWRCNSNGRTRSRVKRVLPCFRAGPAGSRVSFSDRTGLTAGVRYRYTGPVRPVTGRNRSNTNLNSNFLVEAVLTGIPAGLAGILVTWTVWFLEAYRPVIPVYRPVWPVYRWFREVFRRLKNGSPV